MICIGHLFSLSPKVERNDMETVSVPLESSTVEVFVTVYAGALALEERHEHHLAQP